MDSCTLYLVCLDESAAQDIGKKLKMVQRTLSGYDAVDIMVLT